jgi:hypothetical protein
MSFLSGILKSIINPATLMQLAMGPAGWASLAMRTIGSAIAQQVIQQLGQRLGLPQGIINMAQQAFSAASGNPGGGVKSIAEAVAGFAAQFGLSAVEQGRLERAANNAVNNMMEAVGKPKEEAEEETGGSWLVAMARALGKVMDAKAQQIKDKSDSISKLAGNDIKKDSDGSMSAESTKNQNKLSSETTLLQAYTQEMSMISNAAVNSIKTVGEAQTTIARK